MTERTAGEAFSPAERLLRQGCARYREGRWADALIFLQQAAAQDEGNVLTRYYLGLVLNRLDRHDEAAAHLERVVALLPAEPDGFFHLGLARRGQNRHREAIACFRKVLENAPDHPETWFFLAQSSMETGLPTEAAAAYGRAIAARPDFFQALFNLGKVRLALGDKAEAERCFRQVVALAPEIGDAWSVLGGMDYAAGRYGEAAAHLRRAAALAPHSRKAGYDAGMALHRCGDRREGLDFLGRAIDAPDCTPAVWSPQRIRIEASSLCNLRCRHCPTGVSYGSLPRTLMSTEIFARVLADMREMGNLADCVMYLGGEPLLHPELPAMIRRVKEESPVQEILLNTNGMLLSGQIAADLADCGVDHLEISVDGRSPAENDLIRRGADYRKIRRNIREFIGRAPECRIAIANTVVRRPDDPDIPATPAFLHEDFPDLPIQTTYAMAWPGLEGATSQFVPLAAAPAGPPEQYCNKPFTEMAVRANGDVVLCCYDLASEQVMGNVAETSLLRIWTGTEYRRLRRAMIDNVREELPAPCRKCIVYRGAVPLSRQEES
ncbi:MAG: tetratricopeptide repeat protein [Thermodesulfobacteriota bacterium]